MTTGDLTVSTAGTMSTDSMLAFSIEVNTVRAALLDRVAGKQRLVGWLALPRRDEVGLAELCAELCQRLGRRLGRWLWDEAAHAPWLVSDDPVRYPPLGQLGVAASPRPPVRIWLAGLSPTQSVAAARTALQGCPALVIGQTAYDASLRLGALTDALTQSAPELIVIAGGFDDANAAGQESLLELCRMFGQVLERSAPLQRPGVIFAGNRWTGIRAAELLHSASGGIVEVVENVQPTPDRIHRAALAQAVNYYYWRLCRRAAGFKQVERWVTAPGHIVSIETSFAQLVQVLRELYGLSQLHALYCGSAWWLHVWSQQDQLGVDLHYVAPNTRPATLMHWPPVQFVSGDWPLATWPRPDASWWDPSGMAPSVASLGQVVPQAMLHVLHNDLLVSG